jgi:hypothetical protein
MINEHLIKALRLLYNKGMDERETHNDHDEVMKLWEAHQIKADVVQVTRTFTVSVVNLVIDDMDVFIHNCEWFLNQDGELDEGYKTYETEAELYEEAYKLALCSAGASAAESAVVGDMEGTLWLMQAGEYTYWNDINPEELFKDTVAAESASKGELIIFARCEFFVGSEDESTEIVGFDGTI